MRELALPYLLATAVTAAVMLGVYFGTLAVCKLALALGWYAGAPA